MENSITWKADRLPPGAYFVVTPRPSALQESTPTVRTPAVYSPPCSASPRHLPGETREGTGWCVPPVNDGLPSVMLSEAARQYIREAKAWLAEQPEEHFLALPIDRDGDVVARLEYTGNADSCRVEIGPIVRKALARQASAVWCGHNHPALPGQGQGVARMSEADEEVTEHLTQRLMREGILLLDHAIIAGVPRGYVEILRSPYVSDWHRRQARLEKLGY